MLVLQVAKGEFYDETSERFVYTPAGTLILEHSLLSLSKWEEKWQKPFLGRVEKTDEELLDYIRCMTLNDVDPAIYDSLSPRNLKTIADYIDDPRTATTIRRPKKTGPSREMITSELIYYWMFSLNIPIQLQEWHLNRLLTLIDIFNIKNSPPKKMSKQELYNRNRAINEANRKYFASMGKQ